MKTNETTDSRRDWNKLPGGFLRGKSHWVCLQQQQILEQLGLASEGAAMLAMAVERTREHGEGLSAANVSILGGALDSHENTVMDSRSKLVRFLSHTTAIAVSALMVSGFCARESAKE